MQIVQAVFLRYALALPLALAWALPTEAATVTVSACTGTNDHTKIQTAINSAVDGDVVQIQAGTCAIGGLISWTNKNITVQGAGIGATTLNSNIDTFHVNVTNASKANFRITGMTITGKYAGSNKSIYLSSVGLPVAATGRFRVDHIRLYYPTSDDDSIQIFVEGILWGLIDHIDFTCQGCLNTSVTGITDDDYNLGRLYGKTIGDLPVGLGTNAAVYVEDSTFFNQSPTRSWAVNDVIYGGRMVFRHNVSVGNAHFQTHPTRNRDRGGLLTEVYNNHFTGAGPLPAFTVSNIRSGTGVFFNNTIDGNWQNPTPFTDNARCPTGDTCSSSNGSPIGFCNGSSGYDGNIEASGWPCFDQIGRNPQNQTSLPFYYWNNGPELKCHDTSQPGSVCSGSLAPKLNDGCSNQALLATYIKTTPHVNGDKDYCVGTTSMPGSCGNHTNTYTPYTYPHPLQLGGGGAGVGDVNPPSTPQNFRILP